MTGDRAVDASDEAGPADEAVPADEVGSPPAIDAVEQGGDAACWANRVCAECGRLNEAERPVVCEACGARFD
jgi:hypothetical protein